MTLLNKPPLSEIFAAMHGIMFLGVAAAKVKGKDDVLNLGQEAAILSGDTKMAVNLKRKGKHASCLLTFLDKARPLLLANPDMVLLSTHGVKGGKASDVATHITDMLERERAGARRVPEHFIDGTAGCAKKFNASYFPVAKTESPDKEKAKKARAKKTLLPKRKKEGVTLAA